jgi:hypothetical protein
VHLKKEDGEEVIQVVSCLKSTGGDKRYIPGKFHVKYWYVGKRLRDFDPF